MSMYSATTPHRLSAVHLPARLAFVLRRLRDHRHEQRERQRLDAELSMLSDRELADIGLSRPATRGTAFGLPYALHR